MWYTREEALRRFSIFFNSVTLAGAFGGLLASAIQKMNGIRGHSGWRWIFILEGLLTIVLAFLSYLAIVDFPEDAAWLTEEERVFMQARLVSDSDTKLAPVSIRAGLLAFFTDYKSYLVALLYLGGLLENFIGLSLFSLKAFIGGNIVGYSLTYFLPTILKGYKYSVIGTQLHSVPPFVAAYAFSLILSFISAKANHRAGFVLFPLLIALTGVGILLNVHNNVSLEYAAVFLVTMGLFSALPIALCWYIMNLDGYFDRAVGSAWMIGFGNIGGIVATFSFQAADAPFYHKGYSVVAFGLCLTAASSVAYGSACYVGNRQNARHNGTRGAQKKLLL